VVVRELADVDVRRDVGLAYQATGTTSPELAQVIAQVRAARPRSRRRLTR